MRNVVIKQHIPPFYEVAFEINFLSNQIINIIFTVNWKMSYSWSCIVIVLVFISYVKKMLIK